MCQLRIYFYNVVFYSYSRQNNSYKKSLKTPCIFKLYLVFQGKLFKETLRKHWFKQFFGTSTKVSFKVNAQRYSAFKIQIFDSIPLYVFDSWIFYSYLFLQCFLSPDLCFYAVSICDATFFCRMRFSENSI